jgi:hypothetical protein
MQDTEANDYRRRFREMELGGLVEAWEKAMPVAVRTLLESELEARRYRVQSLPEPPPPPEAGDTRPPAVSPLTWKQHAQEQIASGISWILWIALLQILGGIHSPWLVFTHAPSPGEPGTARVLLAAAPLVLGGVFLVIHRRARHAPRNGLFLALALFVAVHGLLALLDPGQILRGIVIKILAIMALAAGLRSAIGMERQALGR